MMQDLSRSETENFGKGAVSWWQLEGKDKVQVFRHKASIVIGTVVALTAWLSALGLALLAVFIGGLDVRGMVMLVSLLLISAGAAGAVRGKDA